MGVRSPWGSRFGTNLKPGFLPWRTLVMSYEDKIIVWLIFTFFPPFLHYCMFKSLTICLGQKLRVFYFLFHFSPKEIICNQTIGKWDCCMFRMGKNQCYEITCYVFQTLEFRTSNHQTSLRSGLSVYVSGVVEWSRDWLTNQNGQAKVQLSQIFVAFSEKLNFTTQDINRLDSCSKTILLNPWTSSSLSNSEPYHM